MNKELRQLCAQALRAPFPRLGQKIGDFALFDSLTAGVAQSVVDGSDFKKSDVPALDKTSLAALKKLQRKKTRSSDEAEFVDYAERLIEICRRLRAELR